jgi:hypothetical protein
MRSLPMILVLLVHRHEWWFLRNIKRRVEKWNRGFSIWESWLSWEYSLTPSLFFVSLTKCWDFSRQFGRMLNFLFLLNLIKSYIPTFRVNCLLHLTLLALYWSILVLKCLEINFFYLFIVQSGNFNHKFYFFDLLD